MEQNEYTNESEVELQDGQTEEETAEFVESTEDAFEDEAGPSLEEQLKKAQAEAAKYRRLLEKKTPTVQKTPQAPSQLNNNPTSSNIEEVVLKAQGVDQDSLDYLKKIAAVTGKSLIDAQNDELYGAYKATKEKALKAEKAQLGASRSSGRIETKKSFDTPGLSDDDFKEMWKEKMGL